MFKLLLTSMVCFLFMSSIDLRADEGMWLFNKAPLKYLKEKHNIELDQNWLDHVQRSSVRFNSGGSGSFVSPNGLVMTNHHVGADALQKLSTKERDLLKEGFHARSHKEEKKCVDMELNVLMSIEDVTEQVKGAVKDGMSPEESFKARRAAIAKIEKDSTEKTKLRSNVVTLYQGGQYHLYRFKKYTDVRLVFAPEQQIAFFGGDPDNFEYPRWCLDMCFFRVYEDGKPAKTKHHLKWSPSGPRKGEVVFVSGNPGRTSRMNTVAELEYLRDIGFPNLLSRLNRWEVLLSVYSERNAENERKAKDFLFGVANSRKARTGGLGGLLDPELMARKKMQEKKLREAVAKNPDLKFAEKAWDQIAKAQKDRAKLISKYIVFEGGAGFNSKLFDIARTLLRAAEEKGKPDAERLTEFRSSRLPSTEQSLFSEEPIYEDYEILKLTDGLKFLAQEIGYNNALVQKVLDGKSPRARATQLVTGTTLKDVAARKAIYEGGTKSLKGKQDPMIALAKLVDKVSRKVREDYETKVNEPKEQAYAQIAKVKYAVEGDKTYPDATFTLRLAFGVVEGYEENGKEIPHQTVYRGMYEHAADHDFKPPFDLPKRWMASKDKLNLDVPVNFVCTADIIGGNSGSPVINENKEVVGLIFDGNIYSLVLDFAYTDKQARAISVHSQGMIEALDKVYQAKELIQELTGGSR